MNKVHDIIPGQRRLSKKFLQGKMQFLARGFISCLYHDEALNKEVMCWPEGLIILLDIWGSEPSIALQKFSGRLHMIDPSTDISYDTRVSYKNISFAHKVLSGRMGFYRAMLENRLVIEGQLFFTLPVMRCLARVQAILFRLPQGEAMQNQKISVGLGRFKIYKDILFLKGIGKEDGPFDTEVLRVFE